MALLLHSQRFGVGVRDPKQTTVIAFHNYALLTPAFQLPGKMKETVEVSRWGGAHVFACPCAWFTIATSLYQASIYLSYNHL